MIIPEWLKVVKWTSSHLSYTWALGLSEALNLWNKGWYWKLQRGLQSRFNWATALAIAQEGSNDFENKDFVYGEIPIITAYKLLTYLDVQPHDIVVDLGSGRGVLLDVAALAFQAGGIGIEYFDSFTHGARDLAQWLNIDDIVRFETQDFCEDIPKNGTIYYMSATTWSQETLNKVQQHLEQLAPGTIIITLSHQWESPKFKLLLSTLTPQSWGANRTYIQSIVS